MGMIRFIRGIWVSPVLLATVAALMLAGCNPSIYDQGIPMSGAEAIDGDTIVLGPEHFRLLRIDAAELPGHPCPVGRRPSCIDTDPVWAGQGKQYLQDILDSHRVSCVRKDRDVYGRTLAECYFRDHDYSDGRWISVSDVMLQEGMAMPYRQ